MDRNDVRVQIIGTTYHYEKVDTRKQKNDLEASYQKQSCASLEKGQPQRYPPPSSPDPEVLSCVAIGTLQI